MGSLIEELRRREAAARAEADRLRIRIEELSAAWELLRDSGRILLEAAPEGMDIQQVRTHLAEVPHVLGIHDLHAWTVTSGLPALSAHVVIEDTCFNDGHAPRLLDQLQACLAGHFDVSHSTFQLEAAAHTSHEPGTH